eukprot:12023192-Prorocentrum_lima.AAC.1
MFEPQAGPPSTTLKVPSDSALSNLLDGHPGPFREQDSFQQLNGTLVKSMEDLIASFVDWKTQLGAS